MFANTKKKGIDKFYVSNWMVGGQVIIYLTSDGIRRHKCWCKHYFKESKCCALTADKCCCSVSCQNYISTKGMGPITKDELPNEVKKDVEIICIPDSPKAPREKLTTFKDLIPGHHPPFGEKLVGKVVLIKNILSIDVGVVIDENHDIIQVEKDNGTIAKFSRKIAIRQGTFWVLDNILDSYDCK